MGRIVDLHRRRNLLESTIVVFMGDNGFAFGEHGLIDKYIRYYGLWDTDEMYDLQADPLEMRNLIRDPAQAETVSRLNTQFFETLGATGGMSIPLSLS